MRIVYLLEDTPLFGGVKVVLQHANLLAARGHQVTIVGPGAEPTWYPLEAKYRRTRGLGPEDIPEADVVVATYWTTIDRAVAARRGAVVHFCQGFEGAYTHNLEDHEAIERAYSRPLPALVVSPHLADLLASRFHRQARVVPQPLDSIFRPARGFRLRRRPRQPPRLIVTSPFEIDWKGVPTSLGAVVSLRRRGVPCQLVRLSQWPMSEAERALVEADEYYEHVAPERVPEIFRGGDLLLAASWEQEGFGLPVLEAMACGVPAVVSDIPAFRSFADGSALFAPVGDCEAFADAVEQALHATQWRAMRRAGLETALRFHPEATAVAAEAAFMWALDVARGT